MPSFVYVLGCQTPGRHLTYVGWTTDVERRLAKHNGGTGARTTRGRVWALLHTEKFKTRREAMSREWHLKRDRKFRKELASQLSVPARAQRTNRKLNSAKTGSNIAPDQSI
jgi:putative endonuclease